MLPRTAWEKLKTALSPLSIVLLGACSSDPVHASELPCESLAEDPPATVLDAGERMTGLGASIRECQKSLNLAPVSVPTKTSRTFRRLELLFVSIANIRRNAVHFVLADRDHGDIDSPNKDFPMSINMSILLTLIVSFSIALAGAVHF